MLSKGLLWCLQLFACGSFYIILQAAKKSEQRGQHCTTRHVPASCSPLAPPDHLVIWRGPLVYAPWCQKLAWTVRGGEEVFFVLWLFLCHIVLLCCLAFNTASCLGSVSRGNNIILCSFQFRWPVLLRASHDVVRKET
jgi:hypothetical protein